MNTSDKDERPLDSPPSRPRGHRVPGAFLGLVRRCTGLTVMTAMLAASVLASEVAVQPGERLDTLFYSPAERAAITRERQGLGQGQTKSAAPVSSLVTVNGVVKRQDGNSTAWVNGQAVQDGQAAPPAHRVTSTGRGANLDGRPVPVGETLDLSTLERTDIVAPGAVTIRRSK